MASITIVVPVWNGKRHVENLLSDMRQALPSDVTVVFVDDCSTDGVVQVLRKACRNKRFVLLENDERLGFTSSVNRGILACDGDVILLNTDIRLTDHKWVQKLAAHAEVPGTGVVAPRLRDLAGGLNTTHAFVDRFHHGYPQPGYRRDMGQYRITREIESCTFACAYITRECLDQVGLLEQQCRIYCSDSLFCAVARGRGFQVVLAGDVTLTHAVGGSLANPDFDYNEQLQRDTHAFRSLLPDVRQYRGVVNVVGVFGFQSGYGKLGWNMIRALRRNGIDVRGVQLTPNETPEMCDRPMFHEVVKSPPHPTAPTMFIGAPPENKFWMGGKRINVSMLEVDGFPPSFIHSINGGHEFWTFSEFNCAAAKRCGCQVPVRVIPPPIDTDHYNPLVEPYRLPQAREFNVLSVFEWGERKFVHWIAAFLDAFRGHQDVALHVRTFPGNPGHIAGLSEMARGADNTVPVRLITKQVPEEEMGCLYRGADLVVCLGAEGIGMPALEAMACDVPVLGFGWGAGGEYVTRDRCLTVEPLGLVKAVARCPYYQGFNWGVPDMDHFQRLITWAYHNIGELKQQARQIGEWVRDEYNLHDVGERYVEALVS